MPSTRICRTLSSDDLTISLRNSSFDDISIPFTKKTCCDRAHKGTRLWQHDLLKKFNKFSWIKDKHRGAVYRSSYQLTSQQSSNLDNYEDHPPNLYESEANPRSPHTECHASRPRISSSPNLSSQQPKNCEALRRLPPTPLLENILNQSDLVDQKDHYTAAFKRLRNSTSRGVPDRDGSYSGIRRKVSFEKEPME